MRKIGNRAAHPGKFVESQGVSALRELCQIGYWIASHYSQTPPPPELAFSADRLPRDIAAAPTTADQVKAIEE